MKPNALSRKLKNLNNDELDELAKEFQLKTKPMRHQLKSICAGLLSRRWLFAVDMGLGKTKIILDIITLRKQAGEIKKTIIICPPGVVLNHWQAETEKHSDLSCDLVLTGTAEEKENKFYKSDADLLVVSSSWITTFLHKKYKSGDTKNLVAAIKKYNCLVIDEAHLFKNALGVGFSMLRIFMRDLYYIYQLTGTPFGNDCVGIWPIYYLLDGGETFGRNYTNRA